MVYIQYETSCIECGGKENWDRLMRGKRRISYVFLVNKIRQQLPELYDELCLDIPNPYSELTFSTPTHYVLTHSAIEYFFRKIK